MIGGLANFHFIEPRWLWLLLLVPPLAWLLLRRSGGERALARLADPVLLPYLLDGTPSTSRAPVVAFVASAVLASLALAGPSWSRQSQQLFAEKKAQVVVLSMSPHMLSHDVVPDRLSRVRYKARQLYAANPGGMNALVAYSGDAFTVAPLTTDARSVDDLLSALAPDTMPVPGDDPGKAIDMAADLIRRADVRGGSIVLVTDRADASATAAARRALAAGARVSVLGVGTPRGGPIPADDGGFLKDPQGAIVMAGRDDASLSAVALAGGGRFMVTSDDASDVTALAGVLKTSDHGKAIEGATSGQWQDRGPWLLLPLLPIVALAFRRGWLLVALLALLPVAPSRADGLADLFRTRDQQAAKALAAGDAKRAQSLAANGELRGVAAYRAGDYAASEAALAHGTGSDAQYNLGNALAKQQRYEDALAAYDRALAANPANADAAANRKAVDDFLKQQKQQKQQDPKKDGKNDKGGQGQQETQDKTGEKGSDSQQGQQGKQPGADGKPGEQDRQGAQGKTGEGEGSDRGNDQGKAQPPQGDAATKSAQQRQQAEQAQAALKQQMDAALGASKAASKPGSKDDKPHDLGTLPADDASSKLPADVRRALMRVPDDPGGLLRRKFRLEYQRRNGGNPEE
ncbi:MAG: VWA domain-containing protein [Luteibacter sp.]